MGRTKLVGIAGRYGTRYGSTLRKKVRDVLTRRYAPHTCPFCAHKGRVVRLSTGIWLCKKCGARWAGGAYTPVTELSKTFQGIMFRD